MKSVNTFTLLLGACLVIAGGIAVAQDTASGQDDADVWATIEQQWNEQEDGKNKWVDNLLAEAVPHLRRGFAARRR